MRALVCLFLLVITSCTTSFYKDGKKIASFAGDMADSCVEISDSGAVRWTADKVSHSAATKAAGRAATSSITAAGATATAVTTPKYFR